MLRKLLLRVLQVSLMVDCSISLLITINFDKIILNDGLAPKVWFFENSTLDSLKTADPFAYQNIHPVEPPLVDDLPQPIQLRIAILFRYLLID